MAREEFRRRIQFPVPSIEEIEARLAEVLSPALLDPGQRSEGALRLRKRILTLPVMVAIVVSMVWRQLSSLSEVLRLLAQEGLLWTEAIAVSQQALSKRLVSLPACLFEKIFSEAIETIQRTRQGEARPWPEELEPLQEYFAAVWAADGSTLEALWKRVAALRGQEGHPLAGKMFMMVDLLSHLPTHWHYDPDRHTDEKTIAKHWLERLPKRGLLVFDLGLFSFSLFDAFSEVGKYFVTRLRAKTSYRVVEELGQGQRWRDSIVTVGMYRSNPCRHPLRLVEVKWGKQWYRYLTNVLDPQHLSARQVCELYRRRWRIEDAFLLTKRLLGLSYLWVGGQNGVQVQIYATWVFYAVLVDLCQEVAHTLGQPLERISVEMVFRGLYHYSVAYQRGKYDDVVRFLADHAKLLGIVKRKRKRHKLRTEQNILIWGVA